MRWKNFLLFNKSLTEEKNEYIIYKFKYYIIVKVYIYLKII